MVRLNGSPDGVGQETLCELIVILFGIELIHGDAASGGWSRRNGERLLRGA